MSGPLRVLYVSPHADLGGAERVTLDLIAMHDRAVVEPVICFLRDGPLATHTRDVMGVETFLIPAPPLRQVFAARKAVKAIAAVIAAARVDLVHNVMAWGHVYGGRAARMARKPAVFFQHVGASWKSSVETAAALVKAHAIVANSEFTATGQRKVNPRRAPIHVIHPGTRLSDEPWETRRARGRAALGLADDEFAVGISGRLQPWKGQDVVIRAAASLLHARPHTRLFVIGEALFGLDEPYAAGLRQLATELDIADRVTFTGFRADVPDCLAALDVAVHASVTPEPFGLALIEAMAAGTPVIAADGGATREIIRPGVDGLLTPPGDSEALATALLALCDDIDLRFKLAETGWETARTRFNATSMTRAIEDLYRGLAAR